MLVAESIPEKVDRLENLVAQLRAKLDAAERRSQAAEATMNQLKTLVDSVVENTTVLVGNDLALRNNGKLTAWLMGKNYGNLQFYNEAGDVTVH